MLIYKVHLIPLLMYDLLEKNNTNIITELCPPSSRQARKKN